VPRHVGGIIDRVEGLRSAGEPHRFVAYTVLATRTLVHAANGFICIVEALVECAEVAKRFFAVLRELAPLLAGRVPGRLHRQTLMARYK
jgi:hypothetical protein